MPTYRLAPVLLASLLTAACNSRPDVPVTPGANENGHTAPTQQTAQANAAVAERLPLNDQRDFENAKRGLIASDEGLLIRNHRDEATWDTPSYAFIQGDAPPSVNPSLWRQAQLNNIHGLFKVTEGVYQLRGYDLANMTLIEGKTGWIVVDPLTITPTAEAALAFARKHLGDKPIRAILFTHSHIDHFGGVEGLLSVDEAKANGVRIIAPHGFMEEASSENVMAGVAMQRRAMFMYGMRLSRDARGHVDTGLGKQPAANGLVSLWAPTEIIDHTGQELDIDGVKFVFQFTPASEAPAEFTFYLPEKKAFCGAEVVSRNLHNVYTLRGAKVRDALRWSNYIEEARQMFGEAEVYFASHHWPEWGKDNVNTFLEKQRDIYKFIHDQALRLAIEGNTPREIAEQIVLPEALRDNFATRGYYGTIKHNAKAVYQWYFGWYDGNPANLDALPPSEAGERYVKLAGGAAALLEKAQASFDEGDYRWVAELLNHLVFAEPGNVEARSLLAQTYDQLGYQAESGPWRDVYLSAAYELRHGGPETGINLVDSVGLIRQIPLHKFLDSMASRLIAPDAEGKELVINMVFTDVGESHVLRLKNSVLHHYAGDPDPDANATIKLTHRLFMKMVLGTAGIKDTLFGDELDIDGSRIDLVSFFGLFSKPDGTFNIVEP